MFCFRASCEYVVLFDATFAPLIKGIAAHCPKVKAWVCLADKTNTPAIEGVANVHLDATEHGERLVFLHAVKEGPASRSYGLQVAALAGVPREVVARLNAEINRIGQLPQVQEKMLAQGIEIPPPGSPEPGSSLPGGVTRLLKWINVVAETRPAMMAATISALLGRLPTS